MTLDADRQNELDQAWMGSLLREALQPDPQQEQERLRDFFAHPDFSKRETQSSHKQRFGVWTRWIPMTIAASITLLFGYLSLTSNTDQRAYAAIMRGMQPIPLAREYEIQIVSHSISGTDQTKSAQLFLDSSNRFVVHRRGWLGFGDVWFGKDGSNQWVVPRLGPAIVGSEGALGGWITKRDSTVPYLHIQTVLKRMENDYALRVLPDMNLEQANGTVICERVLGERKKEIEKQNESDLPKTIEFWADKASGIAHRLILQWERKEDDARPVQWTIELKGYPNLSDDWFKPAGHIAPRQRIVTIGKGSDIDALPKE